MVRVEIRDSINAFVVRLQGRFAGQEAEQVGRAAARFHSELRLVVDLTDVTSIDPVGENTLLKLVPLGAHFAADNPYGLSVCERLDLPLFRRRTRSKQVEAVVPKLATVST